MNLSKARSIARTPAGLSLLVLFACAALSAAAMIWSSVPKIDTLLSFLIQKYDEVIPEIKIDNGHASVRGKQPFVVDTGAEKDLALVIDTREGKQSDAMEYLKGVEAGAVLTRDSVVVKSRGEVRIIPISGMPDMVINAAALQDIVDQYRPTVIVGGAALVFIYFCFVKSLQVLIFGAIPYFGARVYSIPLTYGQALKISTMAMAPPVFFDLLLYVTGIRIPASYVIYFAVYVGLLVLAVRDLARDAESHPNSVSINPS